MNFVVDDIVKGISDKYCITDMDMTRGRILSVHGDEIEVRVMSHKSNPFCLGASYVVEAQYFEKIGHIKPFNREEVLELIAKGNQNKLNEYDFYGADLRSANLSGANLSGASNFIYRVGTTVEVEDFETDRWDECAAGIHFFITRQEAVQY